MSTKKLHIGNWEVCCNDMAEMFINDYITGTDVATEDFYIFFNCDESPNINFCPYCGVKIPKLKQEVL